MRSLALNFYLHNEPERLIQTPSEIFSRLDPGLTLVLAIRTSTVWIYTGRVSKIERPGISQELDFGTWIVSLKANTQYPNA